MLLWTGKTPGLWETFMPSRRMKGMCSEHMPHANMTRSCLCLGQGECIYIICFVGLGTISLVACTLLLKPHAFLAILEVHKIIHVPSSTSIAVYYNPSLSTIPTIAALMSLASLSLYKPISFHISSIPLFSCLIPLVLPILHHDIQT